MTRLRPEYDMLADYLARWGPYYEAVFQILGATATLIPIGDPRFGQPNVTTFTTFPRASGVSATFTYNKAPFTFDTPLDLTNPATFQGIVPVATLDGTDETASTPDAAGWTNALTAMSLGVWIRPSAISQKTIIAKWDETSAAEKREWQLYMDGSMYPTLILYDETENAYIGRQDTVAVVLNVWSHLVVTYDGGTANSGCKIYLNGTQVDDADFTYGVFVTMRDTTTLPRVGSRISAAGAAEAHFIGQMAGGPVCPFKVDAALTASDVKRLYELGRSALKLMG